MTASTATVPSGQSAIIRNVAWETYERLIADDPERRVPRLTYDRGELEILTPSSAHEIVDRKLSLIVELVAAELEIDLINVGSMTIKRQDLDRGLEPDSAFYIQHEEQVRGREQIDPMVDPPPDLVIEIEITRSAIAKLPIYATMGVPEIWRWDGERIVIFTLTGNSYREVALSVVLPPLGGAVLTRFLQESRELGRTVWMRGVREWARARREATK